MKIQHDAYEAMLPLWQKVRDTIAGEEPIKAKRDTYLPKLASQKEGGDYGAEDRYNDYLARADFYGAAGRTVQGLVGAIMAKAPAIEGVPEDDLRDMQDALGVNYEGHKSLSMDQVEDAVSVGRYALLVDKGEDPAAKPYVIKFQAEDIVFTETTPVGGRETLSKIIIAQTYLDKDERDPMGVRSTERRQMLVLRLGSVPLEWSSVPGFDRFAGAPGSVYWQEIWREQEDSKKSKTWGEQPTEIRVPTKNGGRFWEEIPCDIVNALGGIRVEIETPPMLALANKMLAHYREGADLAWGRHMCAIPQPYVTGYTQDDDNPTAFVMGCGSAWVFPDPAVSVGFLEFAGAGLGSLENGQAEKKAEAAVLGARMLEESTPGVEAMGTVKLRQAGDRSILSTIAHNVSQAMTRAIQRYLAWEYPRFDSIEAGRAVSYELSTDFDTTHIDPAELTAMTAALQDGSMSWETFAYNMRRGEMLPPGVTDDEERDRIQMGAPGRSRKDEAAMLQIDVREGRISRKTYLDSLQRLGYLADVDTIAEADLIYEEKVIAAELQMSAFQQAGANIGGNAAAGTFGEGVVEDAEPAPVAEPVAEDDAEPAAGGADVPAPSFNELTLGMERMVRAGNLAGANAILAQAAALIGVRDLGEVKEQKPE